MGYIAQCGCGMQRHLGDLKFWQKFQLKPCIKCGSGMAGRMLFGGFIWRTL